MSSINIHYFAALRDTAKLDHETFSGDFKSYKDLYEELSKKYGFTLLPEMIQVAVNDEFASMSDKVIDGSKVVFIPPMAGG
jgi:molybdopterin synthase sulfur carrier subunit